MRTHKRLAVLEKRRAVRSPEPSEPVEPAESAGPGSVCVTRTLEVPELDDDEVIQAVAAALRHGERDGLRVDLLFVDDPTLKELHEQFLDDPTVTDVMAFDYSQTEGAAPDPEAEIYVSVDRARAVALERGEQARSELLLYIVHGSLHLCGFDDHADEDREEMRVAERAVLATLS